MTKEYKFNLQQLDDFGYESFLRWTLVHLVTPREGSSSDLVDSLSEVTKNFTEVTLTVQVNGVSVDPHEFIRGIHANFDRAVTRVAEDELLKLGELTNVRTVVQVLEDAVRTRIEQVASALGFDLAAATAERGDES
jgi:hypothetical protein